MLVNAADMITKARKEGYAVPQININNLEWTKIALLTAQEENSPIILGVSAGAAKYMGGFTVVTEMVKAMDKSLGITVPVALHLDHGSYQNAIDCLDAGFTSIMFDGSALPFDENLEKTKELIEKAHAMGVSVEAEVGSIGGEEDGIVGSGELADPEECRIIAELGVDFLAAGIGNIHGVYPENWQGLNFERLKEIGDVTKGIPLVLHGGTGINEEMITQSISLGVAKINVNTECQIEFTKETRKYFEDNKDKEAKGFDPRTVLAPGVIGIQRVIKEKMEVFGSAGKA